MSDPEDPSTEEEPIATADMEEEEETGPSACSRCMTRCSMKAAYKFDNWKQHEKQYKN